MSKPTLAELLERFARRDRQALSRLLSLAARGEFSSGQWAVSSEQWEESRGGEEHVSEGERETREPHRRPPPSLTRPLSPTAHCPLPTAHCLTIALTGSGGVGKSSLIGRLVEHIRSRGKTVAVLACDPQSPITGGALLGDRIRISAANDDAGVFIRSLATPSGHQAVADNLGPMTQLLRAFGFDVVLVETVGAGQGDTAVRELVDVLVVLLQPESGDDLQWEKAGLLEVADVVVVNKGDLPAADRVVAQVQQLLNLPGCRPVPVVKTSASKGEGVEELWRVVEGIGSRE